MTSSHLYERAQAILAELTAWRRDIHQHPELGFQEQRTAKQVATALQAMGLKVQTGVGGTGVVARLGSGHPAIGLRADMDALPIQEANDTSYASQTPGVMHACGHDGNTTVLLGAAKLLSEMPNRPSGEIRFLFQPCEEGQDAEGMSGAGRLIENGALEGLDYVLGQHVHSLAPVGKIEVARGYAMAAADSFEAVIEGQGAHGAMPHTSIDPIYILSHVIQAINAIVSRRVDPIKPAVISIGSVHGGQAGNIIPERVTLNGTIRSYDPAVRQLLWDELEKALAISRAFGGDYSLAIKKGFPAAYNEPELVDLFAQVAQEFAGEESVIEMDPSMGAEDFSLMGQVAPAAMFMTGVALDGEPRQHHSETFDFDERGLVLGAAVLAETACRLLTNGTDGDNR